MKIWLVMLFVLIGAVVGCSDTNGARGNMMQMTAAELQEEIEESGMDGATYYIDVREKSEFAESHIAGFENIPMKELMNDASQLPMDSAIILLCNTQNRSIQVGESMVEQGFDPQNLTIIMGGISDYDGEKVE